MNVTESSLLSQGDVYPSDNAMENDMVYNRAIPEFSETVRKKLKEKGWTHADLAEKIGVSRPAVTNWLTRTGTAHFPTYPTLKRLCRVLELDFLVDKYNEPTTVAWVPVIEWRDVLSKVRGEEIESIAKQRVPASFPISRSSFALHVRGESMSPNFPEGCVIIVDPDRQPCPGNFVIAQIISQPEVLFRKWVHEVSEDWLEPINPRYPLSRLEPGEYKILGVVVQKIENCI